MYCVSESHLLEQLLYILLDNHVCRNKLMESEVYKNFDALQRAEIHNTCINLVINSLLAHCAFLFPCRRVVADTGRGGPTGQMEALPSWPEFTEILKEEPQEDQEQPGLPSGEEADAGAGPWSGLWLGWDSALQILCRHVSQRPQELRPGSEEPDGQWEHPR